jgi:hypothetical protein
MKTSTLPPLLILFAVLQGNQLAAAPLGTVFSYHGRLNDGVNPANGQYDLQFTLYNASSGGAPVAAMLTTNAVDVHNGLFGVALDFGNVFGGEARWLEIAVRTNGSGAYTLLAPRQELTAAPYALYAPGAGLAATAAVANSTAVNSVTATSLQTDSVTTEKIANGTITDADISASGISGDKIVGGDLQARRLKVGEGHTLRGDLATIAGGQNNTVDGNASVIGGGADNRVADAYASTIGGGTENLLHKSAAWDSIGGGTRNQVGTNAAFNVVAGGADNTIAADTYFSAIPGGRSNLVSGSYGFAAGRNAKAQHYGSFVWADAQDPDFVSTANNQFSVRSEGGVRFETGGAGLTVDGNMGLGTSSPGGRMHLSTGPAWSGFNY